MQQPFETQGADAHNLVSNISQAPDTYNAEEFFTQVASLVPGIIYVFNHRTQANEYSNTTIAAMLGYSPQEIREMGSDMFATIIYPDDLAPLYGYLDSLRTLKMGEMVQYEYRAVGRDGQVVWLRSNDTVFQMAADGSVLRHIGCASDVTVEKNRTLELAEDNVLLEERIAARTAELAALNASLETQVAQRTAQLQRINDELEQLTYIATHDLKGPVSNLSYLTNMLTQDDMALNEEQAKIARWMKTSCAQASEKLDALVQVARSRSADLSPPETMSLDALAQAAWDGLANKPDPSEIDITFDFDAAPTADFPRFEMSSLMENLIGNALKYANPERRTEIVLRSQPTETGTCMTIRDNGTGLNLPRDVEKVFGLFKRAHVEPAGSGIALYTIRKMLERYGGSITVDSVLGEWTEFTLHFPARAAAT